MSNILYDKARQKFLQAEIHWLNDTIKAILVDTGNYTLDAVNHEFFSSIAAGARIGNAVTLSNKTTSGGAADASDVTFTSVSGASAEAIVLYKDTGSEATSPLIAWIDTATGLPITPNGGDIIVVWDNGTNKIFKP